MSHIDTSLKYAVLGAGGFLGSNLVQYLVEQGCDVHAFGRSMTFPDALQGARWVLGSFFDVDAIEAAIGDADIVFHLITATTPVSANSDMANDIQQNVLATLALLEACRRRHVRRVVFVSSGGTVYGMSPTIPSSESQPCWPISAYGVSKLTIERYLHLYHHHYGLDYRILRVANPYGRYQMAQKNQGVIAAFVRHALRGEPVRLSGDGLIARDYVYVDDVTDALVAAAMHDGPDRLFNVGSGVARSLNDVIASIELCTGRPLRIERYPGNKVDVPVSCLDLSLSSSKLGWAPKIDFADGLQRTIDWMSTQVLVNERIEVS